MTSLRKQRLNKEQVNYTDEARKIAGDKKRKNGPVYRRRLHLFLLIVAGAVFVYHCRSKRTQTEQAATKLYDGDHA